MVSRKIFYILCSFHLLRMGIIELIYFRLCVSSSNESYNLGKALLLSTPLSPKMIYVSSFSQFHTANKLRLTAASLYSFCVIKSQPRYKLLYTQKYFNLMPSYLFVFIILNCFLYLFVCLPSSFSLCFCV